MFLSLPACTQIACSSYFYFFPSCSMYIAASFSLQPIMHFILWCSALTVIPQLRKRVISPKIDVSATVVFPSLWCQHPLTCLISTGFYGKNDYVLKCSGSCSHRNRENQPRASYVVLGAREHSYISRSSHRPMNLMLS